MTDKQRARRAVDAVSMPPSGSIDRKVERRAFEDETKTTVYSITADGVIVNANGHVVCWPLASARDRVSSHDALAFLDR